MTFRYLIFHFGRDRLIRSVLPTHAEEWLDALESGRLVGARTAGLTPKEQTKRCRYGTLSEQSIRKEIRNAKTIFNWAVSMGYVKASPFADFCGTPLPTGGSDYHVSLEVFSRVLDACRTHGWKVFLGLQRYAGLRRGEALTMVWAGTAIDREGIERKIGVDLAGRKLRLVAPKTRMYREVPIVPELAELLSQCESREGLLVPPEEVSRNNLRVRGETILKRANIKLWPKLYQTLRSSCENQWKAQGIAEPTYAAWMGHGVAVSRKHYVSPMQSEFDAVTRPSRVSQNCHNSVDSDSVTSPESL